MGRKEHVERDEGDRKEEVVEVVKEVKVVEGMKDTIEVDMFGSKKSNGKSLNKPY